MNSKLISTQEYNRRIAADEASLDKQKEEIEKKQFERQKKFSLLSAIINGATAVTKILAETPKFDFGVATAIQIGLATALTAAQLITIGKQKFAEGGIIPDGPSHKNNGIKLVDGQTGQVRGEIEGGEPILSKKTYANNKEVIDALLRSSMYGNGRSISPFYKNTPYKTIDVMGLSRSIQKVRHYESGGIAPAASAYAGDPGSGQSVIIPAMSDEQTAIMKALLQQLSQPIEAVVQYGSFKTAKKKDDGILEDAIFRKNNT